MTRREDRDAERFPMDSIGDQLWRLARAGGSLDEAREVTFTIDFPTLTSVAVFIADLEELFPERLQDRISEQTLDVTLWLVPEHSILTEAQGELEELAVENGAEMMGAGV